MPDAFIRAGTIATTPSIAAPGAGVIARRPGRPRAVPDVTCENCGKSFRPHTGNANRFCSRGCVCHQNEWPASRRARLRRLWAHGHSAAEIGRRLGVTKNAVIGKASRMNLPGRPSPIPGPPREVA